MVLVFKSQVYNILGCFRYDMTNRKKLRRVHLHVCFWARNLRAVQMMLGSLNYDIVCYLLCITIHLSIHPSIHPSIHLSIYLSIYLFFVGNDWGYWFLRFLGFVWLCVFHAQDAQADFPMKQRWPLWQSDCNACCLRSPHYDDHYRLIGMMVITFLFPSRLFVLYHLTCHHVKKRQSYLAKIKKRQSYLAKIWRSLLDVPETCRKFWMCGIMRPAVFDQPRDYVWPKYRCKAWFVAVLNSLHFDLCYIIHHPWAVVWHNATWPKVQCFRQGRCFYRTFAKAQLAP